MNEYGQIVSKIRSTSWLIMPESLSVILEIVDRKLSGHDLTDDEIRVRIASVDGATRGYNQSEFASGVGVLPMYGPIFPKANMMTMLSGATSIETFQQEFRALLNNDAVRSIVMDIDSPGGASDLIMEMGAEIYAARDIKPIYAVANTTCGSAALWLASQATKFYATPSGSVGSIGVYTVHEDHSVELANEGVKTTIISAGRFKVEGNPYEPLSTDAKQYRQEVVNDLYSKFVDAVARGRNVSANTVIENFGQGRMLLPDAALDAGMIDAVATLDDVLGSLLQAPSQTPRLAAASALNVARLRMEHVPEEHSEPGTGEIVPVYNPEEPDVRSGSRRDSPPAAFPPNVQEKPNAKGGNSMNPLLRAYAEKLGISISDDMEDSELRTKIAEKLSLTVANDATDELFMAAVAEHTLQLHDELGPLREARAEHDKRRAFAEQYPAEAARLERLEKRDRQHEIDEFVANASAVKDADGKISKFKLSTKAQETVREAYGNLRMGALDGDGLATLINTIASTGGVVEMGERGSSRVENADDVDTSGTVTEVRQAFANKVNQIMSEDTLTYTAAISEAAKRYPDLFEAYQSAHTRK